MITGSLKSEQILPKASVDHFFTFSRMIQLEKSPPDFKQNFDNPQVNALLEIYQKRIFSLQNEISQIKLSISKDEILIAMNEHEATSEFVNPRIRVISYLGTDRGSNAK